MKSKKLNQSSPLKLTQSEKKQKKKKKKSEIKINKNPSQLSLSKQKYIETIFKLQKQIDGNHAHVKDIASELGIKMASVTETAKFLEKKNLISYKARKQISLTENGLKMACELNSKHETLFSFFHNILKCKKSDAEYYACEVEHIINEDIRERIENLIKILLSSNKKN